MKNVLKLEELGMFLLSILAFFYTEYSLWWFLVFMLAPDISMLGYVLGPKVGAIIYNLFHHRGIAILVIVAGFYWHMDIIYISGIILFGHSSMDRLFGYGLKY